MLGPFPSILNRLSMHLGAFSRAAKGVGSRNDVIPFALKINTPANGSADMSSSEIDTLRQLHTDAMDAMNGYDEALKDSNGQNWFTLFEEMRGLHREAARELAMELHRLGDTPSEDGSFMSTVHRSIIKLRSLFGGLDESVLPGLIDGEERNLSRYNKALQSGGLHSSALSVVEKQKRELGVAIARMRVETIV